MMTSSGTLQNIAYNSAHIEQLNVLALTFKSNIICWLGDLQNSVILTPPFAKLVVAWSLCNACIVCH